MPPMMKLSIFIILAMTLETFARGDEPNLPSPKPQEPTPNFVFRIMPQIDFVKPTAMNLVRKEGAVKPLFPEYLAHLVRGMLSNSCVHNQGLSQRASPDGSTYHRSRQAHTPRPGDNLCSCKLVECVRTHLALDKFMQSLGNHIAR